MTSTPDSDSEHSRLIAVIPAGGVGSRLWPLSLPERPKFLLDLLGQGRTLLQSTVDRVESIASDIYIVTGERHADAVAAQVPEVPVDHVLTEPSPRDSMAAIALAAAVIERDHGPQVMGSFAADHVIREPLVFAGAVRTAIRAATTGKVVVIGLEPTEASSAYGYIKRADALSEVPGAFEVEKFTEKPDHDTATAMLADGSYAWNAGMYVVRTDVLLGHLQRLQPDIHDAVRELATAWGTPEWDQVVAQVWPGITKIAIDHAIAEPVAATGGVAVVPATFDWHDVGDFASLVELASPGSKDTVTVGRPTASVDVESATGVAVIGGITPVAVVGVDNVVVVQTDDAILIVSRDASQDVKQIADRWAQGR